MHEMQFKFRNGDPVTEKITGFSGIITGTAFYLTGCTQHLVTAPSEGNKEPIALWYDEGRLKLIEDQSPVLEESVKGENNGCDSVAPGGSRGN